jgi:hypothetical protein
MQLIKRFTKSMWESIIADVFPQHLDFHTVTKNISMECPG